MTDREQLLKDLIDAASECTDGQIQAVIGLFHEYSKSNKKGEKDG